MTFEEAVAAPAGKVQVSGAQARDGKRVLITSTTSELRDALLASYPDAAYFGAPVVAVNRGDETAAAWTWLLGLVRKRTGWWPALGIALQHAAQDGGELARTALADFLESYQHSIARLEWTEPMAKLWPDVRATCRGTGFGEPDYRLATIITAQRALWDLSQTDTRMSVEGAAPDGDWLIVDVQTQSDLESLLAASARVEKYSGGNGPWHWVLSQLVFRPSLEPMMVGACAKLAAGSDVEVRAMLDWFFEEHDLWRYVDLLDGWNRTPPAWWKAAADTIPPGWRFPIRAENAKTLGEVAVRALSRAREQTATKMTIDLPPVFGGRAA
jgi:hypothetical protein